MIPDFTIAANGQDISALLRDRLLSLTVTDEAGYQSDALEIRLDNRNSRISLPAKGAALTVALGYRDTGLLPTGSYTVDELQLQGPPQTLTIRAHAANMIATLKEPRERSWDDISLGNLVTTISAEHELTARVAPELAGRMLEHIDQTESDLHLLTRLAREYGAVAKPAHGFLIFAPRSEAKSVSGSLLAPVTLNINDITSYRVTLADRDRYGSVVARWQDTATGNQVQVTAGIGKPVYNVRRAYPDAQSAQRAARVKLADLNRGTGTVYLNLPGRVELGAETPLDLNAFGDGIDGRWIVTRATHTLNKRGLVSRIEAQTGIT